VDYFAPRPFNVSVAVVLPIYLWEFTLSFFCFACQPNPSKRKERLFGPLFSLQVVLQGGTIFSPRRCKAGDENLSATRPVFRLCNRHVQDQGYPAHWFPPSNTKQESDDLAGPRCIVDRCFLPGPESSAQEKSKYDDELKSHLQKFLNGLLHLNLLQTQWIVFDHIKGWEM